MNIVLIGPVDLEIIKNDNSIFDLPLLLNIAGLDHHFGVLVDIILIVIDFKNAEFVSFDLLLLKHLTNLLHLPLDGLDGFGIILRPW